MSDIRHIETIKVGADNFNRGYAGADIIKKLCVGENGAYDLMVRKKITTDTASTIYLKTGDVMVMHFTSIEPCSFRYEYDETEHTTANINTSYDSTSHTYTVQLDFGQDEISEGRLIATNGWTTLTITVHMVTVEFLNCYYARTVTNDDECHDGGVFTGIVPDLSYKIRFIGKSSPAQTSSSTGRIGQIFFNLDGISQDRNDYEAFWHKNLGNIYVDWGAYTRNSRTPAQLGLSLPTDTLDMTFGNGYIKNNISGIEYQGAVETDFDPTGHNIRCQGYFAVKEFIIYDASGNVIFDGVAARQVDTIGLFDFVSESFKPATSDADYIAVPITLDT